MFKLICIIGCSALLCQMALGDSNVCQEKKADGTTINHQPGDKWLEHPDQDDKDARTATVVIKYSMTCTQDGDGIKVKPTQCYFEDSRKIPLQQGMYVDPGCYKRFGQWLTKCVWNGDHLEATYTNGGGREETKTENEGIKWC